MTDSDFTLVAENAADLTGRWVRRPWLWFSLMTTLAVLTFSAGGTLSAMVPLTRRAPHRALRVAHMYHRLPSTASVSTSLTSPPPPTSSLARSVPANPTSQRPTAGNVSGEVQAWQDTRLHREVQNAASGDRSVDSRGAIDPGGAARVPESSPLIQAIIEAGFSRASAARALAAVMAKSTKDVPRAIEWLLRQNAEANLVEAHAAREVHFFDAMDFDGYALAWGDGHRTSSLEACGQRCFEWTPRKPSNFPCNVFVYCPLPKCFAPAALPPGSMTGQCWLKHQDDPNNPQVNMKGNYSQACAPLAPRDARAPRTAHPLSAHPLRARLLSARSIPPVPSWAAFSEACARQELRPIHCVRRPPPALASPLADHRRHPDAPAGVQWQAGVVVRKGTPVDTNSWSSRANW